MLESKQFGLWRRLGRRFLLEDQPPAGLGAHVGTTVHLVTDAGVLLRTPTLDVATIDISAAAGAFVSYFVVPRGERWIMKAIWRVGTTGSSRVLLRDSPVTNTMNLSVGGTGEAVLTNEIAIDEGWDLGMESTGNGGDTTITLRILYERDFAF